MKKQLSILAVAALSLTLVGCKDAQTSISKASDALITVEGTKITKGDIYDIAKKSSGANFVLTKALETVCNLEKISVTDDMKKIANDQLESLKKSAGDAFKDQLKNAGFDDEQAYVEAQIYPKLKLQELTKRYVLNNKKDLFKTYSPMKLEIVEFASQAKADAALPEIKNGKALKEFAPTTEDKNAQTLTPSTTYRGNEAVYTTKSNIPTSVLDAVNAAKANGLIESSLLDASTGKAYIVKIIEKDASKFEAEAVDAIIASGAQEIANASDTYWLDKYEFQVFDKDILDTIKQSNPKLVD